jgi:hypothetical protein
MRDDGFRPKRRAWAVADRAEEPLGEVMAKAEGRGTCGRVPGHVADPLDTVGAA